MHAASYLALCLSPEGRPQYVSVDYPLPARANENAGNQFTTPDRTLVADGFAERGDLDMPDEEITLAGRGTGIRRASATQHVPK